MEGIATPRNGRLSCCGKNCGSSFQGRLRSMGSSQPTASPGLYFIDLRICYLVGISIAQLPMMQIPDCWVGFFVAKRGRRSCCRYQEPEATRSIEPPPSSLDLLASTLSLSAGFVPTAKPLPSLKHVAYTRGRPVPRPLESTYRGAPSTASAAYMCVRGDLFPIRLS